RLFVVQVSPQPAAVILASPPDWESRFLARTLGEVAHLPLKTYVEAEPGRWRDAATLLPVAAAVVARAAAAARLVAEVGAADRFTTARSGGGVLSIVTSGGH